MDILDIFWTFYLNHLSPLWGYFLQEPPPPPPMTSVAEKTRFLVVHEINTLILILCSHYISRIVQTGAEIEYLILLGGGGQAAG